MNLDAKQEPGTVFTWNPLHSNSVDAGIARFKTKVNMGIYTFNTDDIVEDIVVKFKGEPQAVKCAYCVLKVFKQVFSMLVDTPVHVQTQPSSTVKCVEVHRLLPDSYQ